MYTFVFFMFNKNWLLGNLSLFKDLDIVQIDIKKEID